MSLTETLVDSIMVIVRFEEIPGFEGARASARCVVLDCWISLDLLLRVVRSFDADWTSATVACYLRHAGVMPPELVLSWNPTLRPDPKPWYDLRPIWRMIERASHQVLTACVEGARAERRLGSRYTRWSPSLGDSIAMMKLEA